MVFPWFSHGFPLVYQRRVTLEPFFAARSGDLGSHTVPSIRNVGLGNDLMFFVYSKKYDMVHGYIYIYIYIPWRIHGAAIYGNMDPINIPCSCSMYTIDGSHGYIYICMYVCMYYIYGYQISVINDWYLPARIPEKILLVILVVGLKGQHFWCQSIYGRFWWLAPMPHTIANLRMKVTN